ncbi:MAG: hypothetical protein HVN35_11185 [Methanobacteriaceae archaeon]|nr:hypothetical protein [Methanobacteriaceae archaeon]
MPCIKTINEAFQPPKGHYAGFKMTLAVEYETLRPLCNTNSSWVHPMIQKILDEINA